MIVERNTEWISRILLMLLEARVRAQSDTHFMIILCEDIQSKLASFTTKKIQIDTLL